MRVFPSFSSIRPLLLAAILYAILCLIFFGKDVLSHGIVLGGVGGGSENIVYFAWILEWWRHSILHFSNPFHTTMIFAEKGVDLSWNPLIMPTFGILLMPVTGLIGAVPTANIVLFLLPVLAALSAFLLCHHLTRSFLPSFLGGYIFGFSAYMQDAFIQSLANTGSIFLIPLLVYLSILFFEGTVPKVVFILVSSILFALQFGIFPETSLTLVLFGSILLSLCWLLPVDRTARGKVFSLTIYLALAFLLSILLVSPELYAMLVRHYYSGPKFGWSRADLLSFFIPNYLVMLGFDTFKNLSQKFVTGPWSCSGYLGVPLILTIALFVKRHFHSIPGKILSLFFLIVFIAALGGPTLLVAGHSTLPMPWTWLMHVPILNDAQPHRFTLYLFLVSSVMVARWASDPSVSKKTRWVLSLAIVVFLLPIQSGTTFQKEPDFFADGTFKQYFKSKDNLFILSDNYGMESQIQGRLYFKIADGISEGPDTTSIDPDQGNVSRFLRDGKALANPDATLSRFFAEENVKAVIATPGFRRKVDKVLRPLGMQAIDVQNVRIYLVGRDHPSRTGGPT